MKMNTQLFVMCAMLLFNSKINGEWTGLAHARIFDGEKLAKIFGISLQACTDECDSRALCMSVNYNRKLLLCELNGEAANDTTDLFPAYKYVYVGKKDLKQVYFFFFLSFFNLSDGKREGGYRTIRRLSVCSSVSPFAHPTQHPTNCEFQSDYNLREI